MCTRSRVGTSRARGHSAKSTTRSDSAQGPRRYYPRGWDNLSHGTWHPGEATIPSVPCAPVPLELCPLQIKKYEKLDSEEERATRSRHIFDHYIMKELLACSHVSARQQHGRDVPTVPTGSSGGAPKPPQAPSWDPHPSPMDGGSSVDSCLVQPCLAAVPSARDDMVLSPSQPFSKSATEHVQSRLSKKQVPPDLFQVGIPWDREGVLATCSTQRVNP